MGVMEMLVVAGGAGIGFYVWLTAGQKKHDNLVESVQFPEGWEVARAEPLAVGGILDLRVSAPTGMTYAITAKTHLKHVTYTKNLFGEQLKLPDGRNLVNPSPIDEALSTAQVVGATPVLWLPYAKKQRPKTTKKGVILVFGPKASLLKALKAR